MKEYTLKEYVQRLMEHQLVVSQSLSHETGATIVDKISYNSKEVTKNTLFVCKGNNFKEEYLDMAIDNGALAYISLVDYNKSVPCILVNNIHNSLSLVSNIFFDYPWKKLKLIGITGTKGKSTTSYYVKYILDEYLNSIGKQQAGIISSINTYDGVTEEESHITTPESLDIQVHFNNAANSGLEYMVTEVSSQALKYGRLYDVSFDIGVFLNISEDHISPVEHTDFEDYFASKLRLFSKCKTACINLQSDHAQRVLEAGRDSHELITFGTSEGADIYCYDIKKDGYDTLFRVKTARFDREFKLTMPGLFNVENALGAIAVAYSLDIPVEYIYSGLEKARSSGRMEIFSSQNDEVIVIVDYAHNKLSFNKLYESVREEYKGRNVVTIFGCPGGKAYSRRKDLGLVSGQSSDKIVLTAEDPAMEDVRDICNQIAQYVRENNSNLEIIEDRGEAIRKTIMTSPPNTIILLTGKGNEKRQKYGKEYIPCPSDVDYTIQYLNEYDNLTKEVAFTK